MLALFGSIIIISAQGQFYKNALPTTAFSESFSKLVLDFRNNFSNVRGQLAPKEVGIDTYESLVKLPGSIDNYITISHSVKDRSASFQATMYKGEDYNNAVKIYQNLFRLIKKTRVKWVDRSLNNFEGKMEPAEGLNFTVSYLKVQIQDDRYRDFVTEVELVSTSFSNWEVHVNIVKKKLDVEIAPDN